MAGSYLIIGGNFSEREETAKKLYSQAKPPKTKLIHDPDLIQLTGENSIGIDQVRELEHSLSLKPHSFPPKVGLITQAEKLTIEAQNALLKILEEPVGDSVLILTAPRKENLTSTVVSRCQLTNLPEKPEIELSREEIRELTAQLEKILAFSSGKRIKFLEEIKGREEATAFCQAQLVLWREILLKKINQPKTPKAPYKNLSTNQIATTIRQIEKTLKYLKANANPRLALDNLLLSYPTLPK